MSEKPFHVTIERHRRLLTFRARGLWDLPTVVAFRAEMARVSQPLVARGGGFDVFADLSGFPPQAKDVAAQLEECVLGGFKLGMRRCACLASSAITRLQFGRMAGTGNCVFVASEREALDWLAERKAA